MSKKFESRGTEEELRYYASDLNKYADQYLSRNMSFINLDMLCVRRTRERIRVIEYKHELEHMPSSQKEALKQLSKLEHNGNWIFDVYIVRGDGPDTITITDVRTNKDFCIEDEDTFVRWMEFRLNLED